MFAKDLEKMHYSSTSIACHYVIANRLKILEEFLINLEFEAILKTDFLFQSNEYLSPRHHKLVHVILYVILGRYFGMILQNFGMKIYHYLLF